MNNQSDFIFQPIEFGSVTFRNPLYIASGPTTRTIKQVRRAEECGWGGVSLKLSISPEPYINREPRYGWFADQGIFAFTAEKRLLPDQCLELIQESRKQTSDLVIMANITYAGEEDIHTGWGGFARQCAEAGAHIIELNMCCPNMSFNVELSNKDKVKGPRTGASLGQDPEAVSTITRVVKESVSIPVFVKLTPEGGKIAEVARACFEAGADAVGTTANRLAIPPFDIYNPAASPFHLQKELSLSCFSGEIIKPLGLRDVYEMRKLMGPGPVITGTGGIRNYRDIIQMAFMGANLFGICTETIISGFDLVRDMIDGIRMYMEEKGYHSMDEFQGSVVNELRSAQTVTLSKGQARVKDPALSAPCVVACPSHVPAQGYTMAVARGDFRKAYDLITSSSPLQSICGYACNHPCETACIRGNMDDPIRIKEIKRFVLEYGMQQGWAPDLNTADKKGQKIAVIGAGPAGLSSAFYLQLAGHEVTIFERETEAGGLLRYGIPRFRLPAEVVDYEIRMIEQLGVTIKTSREWGKDFRLSDLRQDGFQAVILAVGAPGSLPLNVPGEAVESAGSPEAIKGYHTALAFLDRIRRGESPRIGDKVVVIGGGFSAVDAARTCMRLGAREVYIAYRRTRDEMPATPEEITEAEEEGVKIMYLVSPVEILSDQGKITSVRLVNFVLGDKDDSDRRRPLEVEGTEFTLNVDTVISALGQKLDSLPDPDSSRVLANGRIKADPGTFETGIPGVFAVGDAALGASDIISSIASARHAAAAVDQKLSDSESVIRPVKEPSSVNRDHVLEMKGNTPRSASVRNYTREASSRSRDFEIYSRPFTETEAVDEASRCLNCGCGEGCMICADICNSFAISSVDTKPLVDKEECVGCGICVWRCPNDNLEMVAGN
jgi:NADPH-dependent glutamate synthase beta subunit-like oxidoreductase/dihydroorotate dehydrogenase